MIIACGFLLVALEDRKYNGPLDAHCYSLCVLQLMTSSTSGLQEKR